jgi:malate dehydrogenase (oxaloacetate-decarboxylating)
VLAALTNSLKLVNKKIGDITIVMSGAGAAGTAIARLLTKSGAEKIVAFDIDGCVTEGFKGNISDAMKGADVFIGVSAPNVLTESDVASMAKGSIVFALANPDPEIDPVIARKYATVVATGRSDQPNQINNVLAFPGIFRGLLDANAHKITDELLIAAAEAIASCVSSSQLNASFIVPSVFDSQVVSKVAAAVKKSV